MKAMRLPAAARENTARLLEIFLMLGESGGMRRCANYCVDDYCLAAGFVVRPYILPDRVMPLFGYGKKPYLRV
jgi:hypothetical protein